ncbi:hypothetical protein [Miltoncostaea oceani]|uniref:hypothetical protein n=1 Tax=Miltoncostaea oceani TaxID=2843216 RepID=UPI001C3CD06A|nr:hypothetical protein [Miltoncostaea oceani]
MQWWMAGLVLSALVGLAARDIGRPGAASPAALLLLRAVGGMGLVAMAALSLRAGSSEGAAVAAVAAFPLLIGLTGGILRARPERRPAPVTLPRPAAARTGSEAPAEERRAA